MLKMLKRLAGLEPEPARAQRVRRAAASKRRVRDDSDLLPLPEVTEGNDPTDWDLWEDSVNSQLQGLGAAPKKPYADTVPSELDGLDPFSRVSKNSDL